MPEVTRQHMLEVLARVGMGWSEYEIHSEGWPCFSVVHIGEEKGLRVCRRQYGPWEDWSPDTEWGAAGELWEAMRKKPSNVWDRFCGNLEYGMGSLMSRVLLRLVIPFDISHAAFEALEDSR